MAFVKGVVTTRGIDNHYKLLYNKGMDTLSFIVGGVTVFLSILVGYFFAKGKPPEDVAGSLKRTISGAKAEGEILNNPEPEDEQVTLRAQWHNKLKKIPSTPPPEGLILTDDEQEAMSP